MYSCPRYPQLLHVKTSAVIQPDMLSAALSVGFLQYGHIMIFPEDSFLLLELLRDLFTLVGKRYRLDAQMSFTIAERGFK
jgi:hypothetical protein